MVAGVVVVDVDAALVNVGVVDVGMVDVVVVLAGEAPVTSVVGPGPRGDAEPADPLASAPTGSPKTDEMIIVIPRAVSDTAEHRSKRRDIAAPCTGPPGHYREHYGPRGEASIEMRDHSARVRA